MAEMKPPTHQEIEDARELLLKMRDAIKETVGTVPHAALELETYPFVVSNAGVGLAAYQDANRARSRIALAQDFLGGIAMWYRLTSDTSDLQLLVDMRKALDLAANAIWVWCYDEVLEPQWATLHHLLRTVKRWVDHTEHASLVLTKALEDPSHQDDVPHLI